MKLAFLHGPLREERHLLPPELDCVVLECTDGRFSSGQLQQLADCEALYVTAAPVGTEVFDACPPAENAAGKRRRL